MSFQFSVTAETLPELEAKLHAALGRLNASPVAPSSSPAPASSDQPAPSAGDAPEPPAAKKSRGRPAKVASCPPAGAESSENPASQATVDNGASAPATTPAAEDAPKSDGAASAAPSFDDMKAALQAVAAKDDGDGLKEAAAVLQKLGYQRVKDVKEEDFGKVIAAANKLLGK